MMHHAPAKARVASRRRTRRGFTLTELLVAMGIIAIIGGITAIGIRTVAQDAKLSSATNTVTAALDAGRALAIRRNRTVVVAFRPQLDGDQRTRIEVITAEFAGDSETRAIIMGNSGPSQPRIIDRFRPISGIARRVLPTGIGIAGPFHVFDGASDVQPWLVTTDLARPQESPGRVIGVMFRADGSTVMQDSARDAHFIWIDVNDDDRRTFELDTNDDGAPESNHIDDWMMHKGPDDEPLIQMVRYLAVYDHDGAREWGDTSTWTNSANWQNPTTWEPGGNTREAELIEYINEYADRLHFNRYTGVVMR